MHLAQGLDFILYSPAGEKLSDGFEDGGSMVQFACLEDLCGGKVVQGPGWRH